MSGEALSPREEAAQLRLDFAAFAQRCFRELNPLIPLAMNWHVELLAAKLAAVFEGRIGRLIINKAYHTDNIVFIFHPAVRGGSIASLDGTRVECHATLRGDDLDAAMSRGGVSAKGQEI